MCNNINGVLRSLMMAADVIRQAKSELLEHGFSDEETNDILQFYVYDKVNKEENNG